MSTIRLRSPTHPKDWRNSVRLEFSPEAPQIRWVSRCPPRPTFRINSTPQSPARHTSWHFSRPLYRTGCHNFSLCIEGISVYITHESSQVLSDVLVFSYCRQAVPNQVWCLRTYGPRSSTPLPHTKKGKYASEMNCEGKQVQTTCNTTKIIHI